MSAASTGRRPRARAVTLALIAAWPLLTLVGSWSVVTAWSDPSAGGWVKLLSNVAQVLTLPGWAVAVALSGYGLRTNWASAVLATGPVFACGLAVVWWLLRRPSARGTGLEPGTTGEFNRSRRAFLGRAVVGVPTAALPAAAVYGAAIEPGQLRVAEYGLPLHDLPPELDGLRIVHVSDTHLGPRVTAEHIEAAVGLAAEQRPDVVALTGDYIHNGEATIEHAATLMRPLIEAATVGVVGVLGNHDWYGAGRAMSFALRAVGVAMIDNQRVMLEAATRRLTNNVDVRGLLIAGVGDLLEAEVLPEQALAGVPSGVPRILLSHNPDVAELPVWRGGGPRVDLMLSGHTHGGQVSLPIIGPPIVPSAFGQRYAGGLVRGPMFPVIVSRGVGMSVLPVRFGVPPEIGVIVLRASSSVGA